MNKHDNYPYCVICSACGVKECCPPEMCENHKDGLYCEYQRKGPGLMEYSKNMRRNTIECLEKTATNSKILTNLKKIKNEN